MNTKVVASIQTPFVNRVRELAEVALHNADFVNAVMQDEKPKDFRPYHFVFAAQMYGAGKTRLGMEFIKQLPKVLNSSDYPFDNLVCFPKDVAPIREILTTFAENAVLREFDMRKAVTLLEHALIFVRRL
jgi:hypothetical protein